MIDQEPRTEAHLEVRQLQAGYSGVTVVENISISVRRGEVVALLGANGSGKTTLLRSIVGALPPMSGQIFLAGRDITGSRSDALTRSGVAYVAQSDNVFEPLTVIENLDMGAYLLPRPARAQRIERAMAIFPALASKRSRVAKRLSGGERRMLAIARALIIEPSLIILDEPTANLTPELAQRLLQDYVRRLAREGVAVLLVEQRAREALRVSDWAYVLIDGHVKLAAPAGSLVDRTDLPLVLLGEDSERRRRVSTLGSAPKPNQKTPSKSAYNPKEEHDDG